MVPGQDGKHVHVPPQVAQACIAEIARAWAYIERPWSACRHAMACPCRHTCICASLQCHTKHAEVRFIGFYMCQDCRFTCIWPHMLASVSSSCLSIGPSPRACIYSMWCARQHVMWTTSMQPIVTYLVSKTFFEVQHGLAWSVVTMFNLSLRSTRTNLFEWDKFLSALDAQYQKQTWPNLVLEIQHLYPVSTKVSS